MKHSYLKRLCICLVIFTCAYFLFEEKLIHQYLQQNSRNSKKFKLSAENNLNVHKKKRIINPSTCICPLKIQNVENESNETDNLLSSKCSDQATKYGLHQKVVSYSLFLLLQNKVLPSDAQYFYGTPINAKNILEIYPGWLMRIYTYPHPYWNDILCNLTCKHSHVHLCNVENLPTLGNVTNIVDAAIWRFLPLGDPTVDIFISRDLDSTFSSREQAAVYQWIESNKSFHTMRDHPYHDSIMLAGLWGAKNNFSTKGVNADYLRDLIINHGTKEKNAFFTRGYDQELQADVIYPRIKNDLLAHDSFFCEKHTESAFAPFPVRRINGTDYVGRRMFIPSTITLNTQCPEACRPPQRKYWTFC